MSSYSSRIPLKKTHRFMRYLHNDEYILLDTEYTCWPDSLQTHWNMLKQPRHLIQISATRCSKFSNNDGLSKSAVKDRLNIIIRPRYQLHPNVEISDYFQELTGLTYDYINLNGVTLEEAFFRLQRFCGTTQVYCYGEDREILYENATKYLDNSYSSHTTCVLALGMLASSFYDIREMFGYYGIDTTKYSSGSLHNRFGMSIEDIKAKEANLTDLQVHNALWDVTSLYYSLCKFFELYPLKDV